MDSRIERDGLGEKEIPGGAYWGIHTARALENFRISGYPAPSGLVRAIAMVKKAACLANAELGYLAPEIARAIESSCDRILSGPCEGFFPLDALQGGAGTSTHMNVNEVIANLALEKMEKVPGDYASLHPIEDVNRHQSTNDVVPTALKIAMILSLKTLSAEIATLQGALQAKEKEFAEIVKLGRTELQEAVPMTLGAEFAAFAEAVGRDRWRTFKCEERLRVVNLGGTAVGTGLGAPQSYIFLVIEKLRDVTGLGLSRAEQVTDATANSDCFVEVSGILKAYASNLIKIAGDLRLMNLLGEIVLPALQAGSSIMPGKINPVAAEAVIQTALKVIANDWLVTETASRSTFQINEFMPLLAFAMLESLELLTNISRLFARHAALIRADGVRCARYAAEAPAIVTAFVPALGYEKAGRLLEAFRESGRRDLREFLCEALGREEVDRILSPQNLTSLGYRDHV
ncbi:MAG: aspartate ammonia-lyase [Candidatus Omnitrophota bacterium]|jgi:aspartate ammonia-lyase